MVGITGLEAPVHPGRDAGVGPSVVNITKPNLKV